MRIERHVLGSQDLMERKRFGYRKGSRGFAMLLARKSRGLRDLCSREEEWRASIQMPHKIVLKIEVMRDQAR